MKKITDSYYYQMFEQLNGEAWKYNDEALDWYFRAKEFKPGTPDHEICHWKYMKYKNMFNQKSKEAIKHYKLALKLVYPEIYKEVWTD